MLIYVTFAITIILLNLNVFGSGPTSVFRALKHVLNLGTAYSWQTQTVGAAAFH